MKLNPIVKVREDSQWPSSRLIKGDLPKVIGKTKTRLMKVGRQECTPVCVRAVAIEIGLQIFCQFEVQFSSFASVFLPD
jgi:hypothetical protein